MTWLEGASLAQTIYTSRYAHEVSSHSSRDGGGDELARNCVWAYTKSLLASSQLVWREMARGNVYEEEDFGTNTFGLSLLADTHALDALVDLDATCNGVKVAQKAFEPGEEEEEGSEKGKGMKKGSEQRWLHALASLLSLRRNWYGLLRTIIASSSHDRLRMEKAIRITRESLCETRTILQSLLSLEEDGKDVDFGENKDD